MTPEQAKAYIKYWEDAMKRGVVMDASYDGKKAQYEQAKAIVEQEAKNAQRAQLVKELQGIANGGGKAYGVVQGQVAAGNKRIAALASSGRGGMNAGLNSQNAQALNNISGQQAAADARSKEKAAAQGVLGQVIAQGQDANNAAVQQQIADLQYQFGQTPAENPWITGANVAGNIGQAAYTVYGQGQSDPNEANKKKNW